MKTSESIAKLAIDFIGAQEEISGVIGYNAKNPLYKSGYTDLGKIIDAVYPVLAKHGFAVIQLPASIPGHIGVTTMLLHKSGEWIKETCTPENARALNKLDKVTQTFAQAGGGSITYIRRYALMSLMGLYSGDDNDGNLPEQPANKTAQKVRGNGKKRPPPGDCTCAHKEEKPEPGNHHNPVSCPAYQKADSAIDVLKTHIPPEKE